LQILVDGVNGDWLVCSYQILFPFFKRVQDCQKFFIMDLVVSFRVV